MVGYSENVWVTCHLEMICIVVIISCLKNVPKRFNQLISHFWIKTFVNVVWSTKYVDDLKWTKKTKKRSQQHPVFPGGHPSKYWLDSTLLNFSDRTRTGVFNVIWPLASTRVRCSLYQSILSPNFLLKKCRIGRKIICMSFS